MSHVDEGTLHAYLDGELTAVERERVDTHLKGCAACQARLAEERAIIERASRLLGMATPPERAAPPLAQLRQRRLPWWRVRRPLAWAATMILAVGLGWYARALFVDERTDDIVNGYGSMARRQEPAASPLPSAASSRNSERAAKQPQGRLAMRPAAPAPLADSPSKDRDALQRQQESAEVVSGAAAAASNAVAVRETSSVAALGEHKVDAAGQPSRPSASVVTVRGRAAAAPAAQEPQMASHIYVDGAPVRRAAAIVSARWRIIARQPAHDVLGVEPVVIPGFAVRAYRRNPAAPEIAVEQVTDAGTTISLIERRVGTLGDERADSAVANAPSAMAKTLNERLARFVGSLRIEIEGPLTPDSLSRLLELVR